MQNYFSNESLAKFKKQISTRLAFLLIGFASLFLVLLLLYAKQVNQPFVPNENLVINSDDLHSEYLRRIQMELERQANEPADPVTETDLIAIRNELERQANEPADPVTEADLIAIRNELERQQRDPISIPTNEELKRIDREQQN